MKNCMSSLELWNLIHMADVFCVIKTNIIILLVSHHPMAQNLMQVRGDYLLLEYLDLEGCQICIPMHPVEQEWILLLCLYVHLMHLLYSLSVPPSIMK